MGDVLVFAPRRSHGRLSLLLLALALLVCSLPATIGAAAGKVPWPVGLLAALESRRR